MRLLWTALLCGALGCGAPSMAAPVSASLPLADCRLEHPLHLSSLAARCGSLSRAEDPAAPEGRRIALAVAVVPALNRRAAAAPVFVLAGGPGQAASDLYASYAGAFARINRNHDIVLVDQRGTGRSAPLRCDYPDDWLDTADAPSKLRDATQACLAKFGARVRFYTTSPAVQDLEAVRIALGYAQIELYGSSYGTRVAQLYTRRFPDAVRAVILDGVTYPEQAIGPDTPSDGERALSLIVTRCEQTAECAAAFPALRAELEGLRRRFGPDKQALTLLDPSSGAATPFEFSREVLNAALRFLSYSATEAALLPLLLHRAAGGDLAPLAAQTVMLARQIGDQLSSGMQNSVICSEDEPFFKTSSLERERIANTYQGADQLEALAQICRIWPTGPVDADLHAPLQSAVPTLLLSGSADPVTPPDDAERAARTLTSHRHLILAGEGHGQLATGCIPKLMADFLDSGDPRSLDASCLERQRPAPFFVTPAGPSP
jgi:pimeloyl-ACP methyl ester carboxylesterase